ncbi:TetR/AcrR family transcriptional regulator [Solihabitans fulvus]|uniref:TetR/AcrR family transcriptional regulator n=1 Tax=Solihabitans fulvus TaxID=1892852 RepID=A0A5B2WJT6_9PSEU|nr:TetR/AcrR family transcriptional regulator [Solihabitans fulvus]KAA2251178.1 TetR/AcrR family transcriptional regulator [Solihabitans fulvus]
MPRPKTHDDALRVRLLDRAGELLSAEGPGALSLRRLAGDVDTSTTAVYSLFGGKPALVQELFNEAFRRFGARLAAVPTTDDPIEDVIQIGLAYRESALADPHLYSIMFSKVVPGFEPGEESTVNAADTFGALLEAVRRTIREERYVAEPAEQIALAAWGLVHGLVSLELNGNLPDGLEIAPMYERALRAQADGWQRRAP